MPEIIDGLTSPTLRHLREQWWDDEFSEFVVETLRPRPGNRILNVGCGEGLAEVNIGRLHISQVRLVGVDLRPHKVLEARQKAASHNQRVGYAAGDARRLPFRSGCFDSVYCVAVVQHIDDVAATVAEFARVTAPKGRVLAVEPDSTTRYLYSSVPSGRTAFEASNRFFSLLNSARGGDPGSTIGSLLPAYFSRAGIEPVSVRLFPVANTFLGPIPDTVWTTRRQAVTRAMSASGEPALLEAGQRYLEALERYERDCASAGESVVEIQNTLLFATVGQRQS